MKKIAVHTAAGPDAAMTEEREGLDVPDVEFRLAGKCRTPEAVAEAVRDADVALCGSEPYTDEVFAAAPKLKMVIRYGVGVDTVDLDAATRHGVMVGHFPDFCIEEVANHALTHMLAGAKKLVIQDRAVRDGKWRGFSLAPMGSIHGETLGLVAFGNIARAMALRGQALDMSVIAHDPYADADAFREADVESVTLEQLASRSDYVSCHLPLNDATRAMLDATFFGHMKPTAYFINTGRGPVVNEADLVEALRDGQIAGAGLDVFETEPIDADHPLCAMDNVTLTAHTAAYSDATRVSLSRRLARDVLAVCRGGTPEFVANAAVLDRRRT
ncbi:C-terminal binding protein [Candidatus Poribacteria bacterium]|jgi:D-3-phosphoglycerate dehydrogenase / 2-oxoglutarate reductase|nr:C-terminal binding protein [Candidatus Poribacteria bacterium]MBT5710648.1 C-terminal binding protein [Candidatus Poribacteria bacterium]MBT7098412.1 C-terminal binding protein [Candidatus Poribacteria bacterium]MBT7805395.1 C-terminal binding protein [Candidatus Poribacteria bacterium]